MSFQSPKLTRRAFNGGLAAAAGILAMPGFFRGAAAQQGGYPSRSIRVVIPTGQGGGAELLARAFDSAWSKLLGHPFEYEFHPGAAGQVGYTLFVQKRDKNGHNLLFGNMGPEMIMYATQKPAYKYPEDFIYFCRTDIDELLRVRAPRFQVSGRQVAGRGGEAAADQRRAQPPATSRDARHDRAR